MQELKSEALESHSTTKEVYVNTLCAYFDIYALGCGPIDVRGYVFLILFLLYCKQPYINAQKVALKVWWCKKTIHIVRN